MSGDTSTLRPHGGYRRLRSFQVTEIIYDGTVAFCDRFIDKRSRTHDQMVQAARSGRQNIAEGSRASATSSQTELRLVNVARASLDELLLDYEDFLRQRKLNQWEKDAPEARLVRAGKDKGSENNLNRRFGTSKGQFAITTIQISLTANRKFDIFWFKDDRSNTLPIFRLPTS